MGHLNVKVRSKKNGLIIRAKKNEYDKEQRAFKPIMEDNVKKPQRMNLIQILDTNVATRMNY